MMDGMVALQLQDPWFNHEFGLLSVWNFACSPGVHVGFLWVVLFPSTSQKHAFRWMGYTKLPIGVDECANVCAWCMMWWTDVPFCWYNLWIHRHPMKMKNNCCFGSVLQHTGLDGKSDCAVNVFLNSRKYPYRVNSVGITDLLHNVLPF